MFRSRITIFEFSNILFFRSGFLHLFRSGFTHQPYFILVREYIYARLSASGYFMTEDGIDQIHN